MFVGAPFRMRFLEFPAADIFGHDRWRWQGKVAPASDFARRPCGARATTWGQQGHWTFMAPAVATLTRQSFRTLRRAFAPPRSARLDDGRHWETSIYRIGPPLKPSEELSLRVAGYEAGAVEALTISGETLFLGSSGRVRAMDVLSGDAAGEFALGSHVPSVITALCSSDSLVAAGKSDGTLLVWSCKTAERVVLRDGSSAVTSLVENNGFLAGGTLDGGIGFWDVASLKRLPCTGSCDKVVLSLAPGPGDTVFAGCQDGAVLQASPDSVEELYCSQCAVTALAYDFDQNAVLLGHEDGHLAELQDGSAKHMARFHSESVRSLQVAELGMLSVGEDGRLGVWQREASLLQPQWGFRGLPAHAAAVADDNLQIFFNCTVNAPSPGNSVLHGSWKRPRSPSDEVAPACEAIVCLSL
mmetsp:Transcript_15969/g.30046  ORF Transcript_15969/g.30046 Transcript_15969/m.30046 type:complete len:414 (+) Transcript_15969:30-1271(+)